MIRLDVSPSSCVVTCSKCPGWARGALDRDSGRRLGARHELEAHPESKRARDTLNTATRRKSKQSV